MLSPRPLHPEKMDTIGHSEPSCTRLGKLSRGHPGPGRANAQVARDGGAIASGLCRGEITRLACKLCQAPANSARKSTAGQKPHPWRPARGWRQEVTARQSGETALTKSASPVSGDKPWEEKRVLNQLLS